MTSNKELVSVRLPKALNKKLAKHVKPMGLSKNAFILSLINRELAEAKKLQVEKKLQEATQ